MISVRALWVRDGGICALCLKPCKLEEASRDHVVPRSKGGKNNQANLQLAHHECNQRRSDRPVERWSDLVAIPQGAKEVVLFEFDPAQLAREVAREIKRGRQGHDNQ